MGDNLFKKTGRKSAKEQLEEISEGIGAAITGVFGADDEKPSGYTKVVDKDPIKDRAEKNVKSRKVYKKVTQKKPVPQKQKSASPKGTKFFDFFTS